MTTYWAAESIGARVKEVRRQRGYRTPRALAEAIPAGNVTAATIQNIESGRKADIGISQFLNIARALGVPPSILLAPVGNPEAPLDLPNLSDDFNGMTAAEFDSWYSATPASHYRPRLAAERVDIDVLNTLRELGTLQRELDRLRNFVEVQSASADPDLAGFNAEVQDRINRVTREAGRVRGLLQSAGLIGVAVDRAH